MVFRDEIPRSPPPLEDSLYRLGISPCPMVGWSDGIPSPINPVVIKYPNHPTSFATLDISWPWHIMKMHINAIQKKNHTCLAQKFPEKKLHLAIEFLIRQFGGWISTRGPHPAVVTVVWFDATVRQLMPPCLWLPGVTCWDLLICWEKWGLIDLGNKKVGFHQESWTIKGLSPIRELKSSHKWGFSSWKVPLINMFLNFYVANSNMFLLDNKKWCLINTIRLWATNVCFWATLE